MKKITTTILLLSVLSVGCSLFNIGENKFQSIGGFWATENTEAADTAVLIFDPGVSDSDFNRYVSVRIYTHGTAGISSVTQYPVCNILFEGDTTEAPQSLSYNKDGIELTVEFNDFQTAVITANWDYYSGSIRITGSKTYNMIHKYNTFRYDNTDDYILDFYF